MYGLIYEYGIYKLDKAIFQSLVHPFFNFGGNNQIHFKNIFGDDKINPILKGQDLSKTDSGSIQLISLIEAGLKFGIGLITSSIPVAFQLAVIKLLKNIESSNSLAFVFADYQMSMGVDYKFKSVAIVNSKLNDISVSSFRQMSGRAGRTNSEGVYTKSTTFLLNIKNASILEEISESLIFNNIDDRRFYFDNKELYSIYQRIYTLYESPNIKGDKVFLLSFKSIFDKNNIYDPNSSLDIFKYYHESQMKIKELFNISHQIFPEFSKILVEVYYYFQSAKYKSILNLS